MIDSISASYWPARPSTSTITPRARYLSLGYERISTTTLSFSRAFLAVMSSTTMGSMNRVPSGWTIQASGCRTSVPTNRLFARSSTSRTSPV